MNLGMFVAISLPFAVGCSDGSSGTLPGPPGKPVGKWELVAYREEFKMAAGVTIAGDEFIAWGGLGYVGAPPGALCDDSTGACNDGVALNLKTLDWRLLPVEAAPQPRSFSSMAWTGNEVLVWGGFGNGADDIRSGGGIYDPATDSWRELSDVGAPSPRRATTPVWTGTEWIFWGGAFTPSPTIVETVLGDGAAFNPATNSWRTLATKGAPSARSGHASVWTGKELVIWGGDAGDHFGGSAHVPLGDGFAYDPAQDTWRKLPTKDAPVANCGVLATWTGKEVLLWDGRGGADTMSAFDPAANSWRPMNPAGPHLESFSCEAWTGKYWVVCGDANSPAGGGIYDPSKDAWRPIPPMEEWGGGFNASWGFAYDGDLVAANGAAHLGGLGSTEVYRYHVPE